MNDKVLSVTRLLSKQRRNQENYKALKANIEFSENKTSVVLITSSIPSEGKSSISLNVAASFAADGKRVLFIDCDLRKSQYAKRLNLTDEENVGFSEVLSGKLSLKNSICQTDVDNLFMVPAGHFPSNPTGLLNSAICGKCMNEFRKVFDYIIVDSAPLAGVIDSAILCKHCDGVVFVVGSGMVDKRTVQKSISQIERAGGKILGFVMNKMNVSNRSLYGTYGKNKYYY